VVEKGRHADEHVGLDFLDEAQIAVRAEHFAAAGADGEDAERRRGVMGLPECQVRRIREHVHEPEIGAGVTDLHQAAAGEFEHVKIVQRVEEGDRVGGAAGGAGHEDGTELALEAALDRLAAMEERAKDRRGPARENALIGNEQKVPGPLRMLGRADKVGLGGQGQLFEVFDRPEGFGAEAAGLKHFPVIGGERRHHAAQVAAQLGDLKLADGFFIQPMPVGGEQA